MLSLVLVTILVMLLLYVIYRANEAAKYWERKGIKSMTPIPFIGNVLPIMLGTNNISQIHMDMHKAFPNEPMIGFHAYGTPSLLVTDADYIEKILIKDFGHFTDHSPIEPDEASQPVDHYHLFSLRGAKWRAFRYKMTPLFTSGKLKFMYGAYDIVGKKLIKAIESKPKEGVILKDVIHLYVLDFVGSAIFGIDSNCLENPGCEFHQRGTNIFDISYYKLAIMQIYPNLAQKLGFTFNNKETVNYFFKVIQDAFNYRKENNISRNDFIQMMMQLMMQLKDKGKIEIQKWDPNDDYLKESSTVPVESYGLSEVALMTQAYTFLTTGVDAVSLSLQYLFYDLALNPGVQDKARDEILEHIKLHSGLTYEALKSMNYLEYVVNESQRLHPLSLTLNRTCIKEYTFPNGYTIREKESLIIPTLAVHLDEVYHTEPESFKPERFENTMRPGIFFPFGDGPRVCIAMRFALLQIKFGAAKILSHYRLKLNSRTKLPLKFKPQSIMNEPDQPIYFDLEPL